jgi:hypothetical protein
MKNYIKHKDKYNSKFANTMYDKYKSLKFGVESCGYKEDYDLTVMRKELVDWQSSGDYSTISEVQTDYKKWLPVNLTADDMCYININVTEGVGKSFHISPAQSVWILNHDFTFTPNVTTTDESGHEVSGTVNYLSGSNIRITFSQPVAGWAYLS